MAGIVKQRCRAETLLKGRDKETELTEERTKYMKNISYILHRFPRIRVLNLNSKRKVMLIEISRLCKG
jgi:hypothetical protein